MKTKTNETCSKSQNIFHETIVHILYLSTNLLFRDMIFDMIYKYYQNQRIVVDLGGHMLLNPFLCGKTAQRKVFHR